MTRRSFFAALASLPLVKKLLPKSQRYVAMDVGTQPSYTAISVGHNVAYDREFVSNYLVQAQKAAEMDSLLTSQLLEAGWKPMGDGPLSDCWTPAVHYKPGDVISLDTEG